MVPRPHLCVPILKRTSLTLMAILFHVHILFILELLILQVHQ
jgi:hypothetical protein